MKILGIDPGTNCGWCVLSYDPGLMERLPAINRPKVLTSGVWNLKPDRYEGAGMRFVKLAQYLKTVIRTYEPKIVAFEEVHGHKGTAAAHIYGGIVATLQQVCEELKVPYTGIPVHHVKKRASGKGNCGKEEVMKAVVPILGREPEDDNEADAVFVAVVAMEKYTE